MLNSATGGLCEMNIGGVKLKITLSVVRVPIGLSSLRKNRECASESECESESVSAFLMEKVCILLPPAQFFLYLIASEM